MTDLKETIELMTSTDHRERFLAEYWQTKIRIGKLDAMLEKYDRGELAFEPICPVDLLKWQLSVMEVYLDALTIRAEIEGIDLGEPEV